VQGEEVVFDRFFFVAGLCWFRLRGAQEIGVNVVHSCLDKRVPSKSSASWRRDLGNGVNGLYTNFGVCFEKSTDTVLSVTFGYGV
jgi:hypothetical protein